MSTSTQTNKATTFFALHGTSKAFIIPNPWDIGTARLLALLGFEALATTSAGMAFSRGQPDNSASRDQLIDHLATMVSATNWPVSADLENGFSDAPSEVAKTVLLAAAAGVVGGSIEDTTGRSSDPLYETEFAAERIRAAVEACRTLPFKFTLTARAENYVIGRPNLGDTIKRLQAFQDAGADVLFAPGITDQHEIATLVRELDRPVNVLAGFPAMALSVGELSELGVRRVSVGGSLARAALGEFLRSSTELRDLGTTIYAHSAVSASELNSLFGSRGECASDPESGTRNR